MESVKAQVRSLTTAQASVSVVAAVPSDARTEILDAAASCFKEQGFSATSIDDVARRLLATKGRIYHHFRSKTDLFFEVYRRGMEINVGAIEQSVNANDSAVARLTRMAFAHSRVLMAQQAYQRVLAQGVQLHQQGSTTAAQRETLLELIDIRNDYETRFRTAIESAAQEASVKVSDPSIASKSFLAVLNSTVFWYSPRAEDAGQERATIAAELVATAMRGAGFQPDKKVMKEMGAIA